MVDSILNYEKNSGEDYYTVLGCDELSTIEQIMSEFKVRALLCHPDKNLNNLNAAAQFAKLQRAKEVLSNDELRPMYDVWRRSGIAMPFEEFLERKAFTSLHWTNAERKKPMITENSQDENNEKPPKINWVSDECDIVRRFRSYDI